MLIYVGLQDFAKAHVTGITPTKGTEVTASASGVCRPRTGRVPSIPPYTNKVRGTPMHAISTATETCGCDNNAATDKIWEKWM